MRISDWSSDVCSSDRDRLARRERPGGRAGRNLPVVPGEPGHSPWEQTAMNALNERDNGHEGVESAGSPVAEVCSPRHLLQQLNQVQEELEQYYLKCLALDSDIQVARLAGDDAKREIQAL